MGTPIRNRIYATVHLKHESNLGAFSSVVVAASVAEGLISEAAGILQRLSERWLAQSFPMPEERGTDPYERSAFFHCHLEITGHPHGEFIHVRCEDS
jgi:hypothetical protein